MQWVAPSQTVRTDQGRAERFCPFWPLLLLALASQWTASAAETPVRRQWTVDGVVREALVYAPTHARTNATPVVFAFHGHGGSMNNAARSFRYHAVWPEAIVVYMQGLNTPGRLTDAEGKRPGWQHAVGDQGDRDLKFFDAAVASLQQDYRVDARRIYATGHSNGGGFTYLLWAARANRFAAFAPSACVGRAVISPSSENTPLPATSHPLPVGRGEGRGEGRTGVRNQNYIPKPVLHVAGENDALVKFAWQEQTIDALRKVNQCGAGQPWGNEKGCTLFPSKLDAPVVTFIHPGTHQFPAAAPAIIVKFFKQHALPRQETRN